MHEALPMIGYIFKRYRPKILRLLFTCSLLLFLGGVASHEVKAQIAPTEPPPPRPKPKVPRTPSVNRNAGEAYKFVDLGNSFWDKGKFHAAEAAYKESLRLWSGNGEAIDALKALKEMKRTN
jgi:hypothetical protein